MSKPETCWSCGGRGIYGYVGWGGTVSHPTCKICNGTGQVTPSDTRTVIESPEHYTALQAKAKPDWLALSTQLDMLAAMQQFVTEKGHELEIPREIEDAFADWADGMEKSKHAMTVMRNIAAAGVRER